MKKSKQLGQVYTPKWIVNKILDDIGYFGEHILDKKILEPSCGDGAFLCEIVRRYIEVAKLKNHSNPKIIEQLEQSIYGIEIDPIEYQKCLDNLNRIVSLELSENTQLNWKLFNCDALVWQKDYHNYFDFIVGNPPYIRIHNLTKKTREFLKQNFQFSTGTLDIYIAFFEIGFYCLNTNGKFGFITPNSFLHNTSYKKFREYLCHKKQLIKLTDFKSNKVFDKFSVYSAISIFDKNNQNHYFDYQEFIENKIITVNQIFFENIDSKNWAFSSVDENEFLKSLSKNKNYILNDFFDIQYGFATLRDKIFIGKCQDIDEYYCLFNGFQIEKSILKQIVKGSRYKGENDEMEWVIFPYQKIQNRYIAFDENNLQRNFPKCYEYLLFHKSELLKRDLDKSATWYEFGRSQGIQKIHQEKIVVNPLVNGKINHHRLNADIFVYSGIFITKKSKNTDWEIIESVLNSQEFYKYIRITGKDLSGGYKSISSKQLKEYSIYYK